MRFGYDPAKDKTNRAKHGVSPADAARIDFGSAIVVRDDRRDYGEVRYRALGLIEGRLHSLAFTMRDGVLRAISLRKANASEVKGYDR